MGIIQFMGWMAIVLIFGLAGLIIVKEKKYLPLLALLIVLINSILSTIPSILALTTGPQTGVLNILSLIGNINVKVDSLSAWFILIINFTAITGASYGIGYLKAYNNSASKLTFHWSSYVLFHLSMIWVCMLQNGLAFLIAWEIMSLASMFLVIFDHHNIQTLKAGINYLVQMHISVVFLTIGFIWVYSETGSFSFDAIQTFFNANNNLWLFAVFFVGFGLKAGFIPLHSWLPHAHPAAPSHISGVMSGVIVKLGIYGIIRMISYLQHDFVLLGEIIISLSVLTGIFGIINAAVHRDFKRMLAYCTIENIGIIGIGIGVGLIGIGNGSSLMYFLGFGGALLHVLNHSLFKSLLFYSAGAVFQQTHTRDMEKLGGLIKSMPKTAVIFLIGAVAICGLPPLNGFLSEFVIYSGLIEGMHASSVYQIILIVLTLAGLSVIGGLSVLTFTKTFGTIFLGQQRDTLEHKPKEVNMWMLVPQFFIIAVMLSVAFAPQFYLNILQNIMATMNNAMITDLSTIRYYSNNAVNISLFSFIFIGLTGIIWSIRTAIVGRWAQNIEPTWGCGYIAPNSSMQYTGKSFSKPLGKSFNFFLIERKQFRELNPGEIFPLKRSYDSHYLDFFEHNFINPFTRRLIHLAGYFRFIQNGRTQSYVLYGIVFIIAVFLLTIFNIIT